MMSAQHLQNYSTPIDLFYRALALKKQNLRLDKGILKQITVQPEYPLSYISPSAAVGNQYISRRQRSSCRIQHFVCSAARKFALVKKRLLVTSARDGSIVNAERQVRMVFFFAELYGY